MDYYEITISPLHRFGLLLYAFNPIVCSFLRYAISLNEMSKPYHINKPLNISKGL
ncbi:hypothetical protein EJK50_0250 [Moraxella catarrhalis]|nr:hypothetical protein EJK50_0250 [Moraxella catarrhalis]